MVKDSEVHSVDYFCQNFQEKNNYWCTWTNAFIWVVIVLAVVCFETHNQVDKSIV